MAFLVGERAFTHAEVHDGAARAAGLLDHHGVRAGQRVLLALPDGIELVRAFLGAVRLGAVAVPVNPRLPAADHRHLADDTGTPVVVGTGDLADRFAGRVVLVAEELERAMAGCRPLAPAAVDGDDAAYAQHTSGTTGLPKAAVHAHAHPAVYFEARGPRPWRRCGRRCRRGSRCPSRWPSGPAPSSTAPSSTA